MLDVDHIVVTGVPPERVAAVIAASGVHRRDPLLLVSTGAVERRVEQVPGIGSVRVARELPGTLHIAASEQGVALWARVPGGVALIGFDGRVQRVALSVPPHVRELRGLARVPEPGKTIPHVAVVTVMSQLPPTFATRVGAISAVSAGDVRLYLIVGGEVRLGDLVVAARQGGGGGGGDREDGVPDHLRRRALDLEPGRAAGAGCDVPLGGIALHAARWAGSRVRRRVVRVDRMQCLL